MAGPRATLRRATLRDLDALVHQRRRMFADMGIPEDEAMDRQDQVYRRWARARLRSGTMVAWVAEAGKKGAKKRIVAGGAVWLQPVQPRPGFDGGGQPYLLSMYTEPNFRGRGLARRIVQEAMRWAEREGHMRMTLHASSMGRGVYERLGFERTWEMKRGLRPPRKG